MRPEKMSGLLKRIRLPSFRSLWNVLVYQPRFVWGAALLPAVVIWVSVHIAGGPHLEMALKAAGFLLGFFGLVLVAIGLSKTRRLFHKDSVGARIRQWWRNVIGLIVKPQPIFMSGNQTLGGFTMTGCLTSAASAEAKTLQERVAALEQRASETEGQIDDAREEARLAVDEVRREFRSEVRGIRTSVKATREQLEEFSVGGLDLEGMGLFWLFTGSMFSTFHEELAKCSVWLTLI